MRQSFGLQQMELKNSDHNKSQIPQNDLKKIARYILENRADILAAWFDYFNSL